MAKLDFPGSPSANQKYPSPAVAGQPVYTWDGEKWASVASQYVPGTAPFDAMAYSGIQVNGSMEVSQERGTTLYSGVGYLMDGWIVPHAGTMATTAGQALGPANGFQYFLYNGVTTAQPTLGATDFAAINQVIEGYRVSRLMWGTAQASPITIGFWSAHVRTGLYSVKVGNGDTTRSYVTTYTQTVSGVWQYNVVTVPGCTDGVWKADNTTGFSIAFAQACGTTYIAPAANTWYNANYVAAPGQVNGVAATSDVCRITGVVILPGTQAPTAAQSPNILRPYDQEIITCQRYWQRVGGVTYQDLFLDGYCAAGSAIMAMIRFLPMRGTPTVTVVGTFNFSNVTGPLIMSASPQFLTIGVTAAATGQVYWFSDTTGKYITLDARL